jgi:hypothetical protein
VELDEFVIVPAVGPDSFCHKYEAIEPSGSEPEPVIVRLFVGSVIVASLPAFAKGDWFALTTVMVAMLVPLPPELSVTVS